MNILQGLYLNFTLAKIFKAKGWQVKEVCSMMGTPLDYHLTIGVILDDLSLDVVMVERLELEALLRNPLNRAEFESVYDQVISSFERSSKAELN